MRPPISFTRSIPLSIRPSTRPSVLSYVRQNTLSSTTWEINISEAYLGLLIASSYLYKMVGPYVDLPVPQSVCHVLVEYQ